jgi:hypothetical protein
MKAPIKALLPFALTLTAATSAHAQSPVRIVCSAATSSAQGLFVSVVSFPGETPRVTLTTYRGSSQTTVSSFSGTRELYQGFYRSNVTAVNSGSSLKISADINMFGGNISNPEDARWNGKLWLSNDLRAAANGRNLIDVSCSFDV